MSALTELQAAVTANGDVEASAVALIEGISAQLAAAVAANDPAAVKALSDELVAQTAALAAAVAANTAPAAPVEPPAAP